MRKELIFAQQKNLYGRPEISFTNVTKSYFDASVVCKLPITVPRSTLILAIKDRDISIRNKT